MTQWLRFRHGEDTGFGILDGNTIHVHEGNMFDENRRTGRSLIVSDVKILMPCIPTKMLGLWRNFHALADLLNMPAPETPLYFLKANGSWADPETAIRKPIAFDGTVVFEGELGVVIGEVCTAVSEQEAEKRIFGYTCVNDVTALEPIQDTIFPHWTRGKGFDTFGPFGPTITTDLDWRKLSVRSTLNGVLRQNYPLSDMVLSPAQLVSQISFDMTLKPGDVIACGTSVGVGRLKPGSAIDIEIEGIGVLSNHYSPGT